MSERQPRRSRKLSWIVFLVLLPPILWLIVSGFSALFLKTGNNQSALRAVMKDVQVALGHYRTEYNSWPDDPALVNANTVPVRIRGKVLEILLGSNRRGIKFIDLRFSKEGGIGLVMEKGAPALYDRWGTCYFMMLDLKLENRIPSPELLPGAIAPPKISSRTPKFLPAATAIFSAGPDRDPNTWADNVCSWR